MLLFDGKDVIAEGPQWFGDLIGVSRPMADRLLHQFEEDGLIKKLRTSLYKINREALTKFARSDDGDTK